MMFTISGPMLAVVLVVGLFFIVGLVNVSFHRGWMDGFYMGHKDERQYQEYKEEKAARPATKDENGE